MTVEKVTLNLFKVLIIRDAMHCVSTIIIYGKIPKFVSGSTYWDAEINSA